MRNRAPRSPRSTLRRLAVVAVVAAAATACSSDDSSDAGTLSGLIDQSDPTSADAERVALEQQVAALQAEVDSLRAQLAERDGNDGPQTAAPAPTDNDDETTTTTPASEQPPSGGADPSTSPVLLTSGDLDIPAGDGNGLEIVMTGTPARSSVPLVVRNNTSQPAYRIEVTGTARDADGRLVASGSSQGFSPVLVQPGEWAFGYVFLGSEVSLDEITLDLSVSAMGTATSSFAASLDVEVIEAEFVTGDMFDRIVGIVRNQQDVPVTFPISVDVACFDNGQLVGIEGSFTEGGDLNPGATDSFSISMYGDQPCATWVIAASGYDF